jgi:hypothetical protein
MGRLVVGILLVVVGVYGIWTGWRLYKNRAEVSRYGVQLAISVVVEVLLLIVLGRTGT